MWPLDGNEWKLIDACIFLCEAREPDHTLNIPFPVYIRLSSFHVPHPLSALVLHLFFPLLFIRDKNAAKWWAVIDCHQFSTDLHPTSIFFILSINIYLINTSALSTFVYFKSITDINSCFIHVLCFLNILWMWIYSFKKLLFHTVISLLTLSVFFGVRMTTHTLSRTHTCTPPSIHMVWLGHSASVMRCLWLPHLLRLLLSLLMVLFQGCKIPHYRQIRYNKAATFGKN